MIWWRHHRVLGNVVAFLLFGVFMVVLLWNQATTSHVVGAIREAQKTNTSLAQETHTNSQLIKSCVDPHGQCFRRGARERSQILGEFNRAVIAAAACASDLAPQAGRLSHKQLEAAITACVLADTAQQKGHR